MIKRTQLSYLPITSTPVKPLCEQDDAKKKRKALAIQKKIAKLQNELSIILSFVAGGQA